MLSFSVLLSAEGATAFLGRLAFGARIEANVAMNVSDHMKHMNGLATFEMLLQLRMKKGMVINLNITLSRTVEMAVMTGAGSLLRSICTKAVVSASFQANSRLPKPMKAR